MRKIIKLLLFILCLAVMALNGCAKNADSEVRAVIPSLPLPIRVSLSLQITKQGAQLCGKRR